MEYSAQEQYLIWLNSVEGMTPTRLNRLLDTFGDAETVWNNPEEAARVLPEKVAGALKRQRTERAFYTLFAQIEKMPCSVICRLSPDYPSRLLSIYDAPVVLYVLGNPCLEYLHHVAVVGSRRASRDGRRAAQEIAQGLAEHDVCIISGLARGVDVYAHAGALAAQGKTIAVLGCGVDIVYPPENDQVYRKIIESGGSVISEYPPGTPPFASNFPARNRIVSGLSDGVLVVEGAKNSGAMITVDMALDQGRDVFAVPGSIYSPLSEGPNQLIFDGAMPVRSHWDILERFGWAQRPSKEANSSQEEEGLADDEKKLVEILKIEEKSFDELANLTGMPTAKLNSLLTILELRGIIRKSPGRIYRA